MSKRLYKPIYDDNGKLDHYQVIDRDTGELLGARSPDFREAGKGYIQHLYKPGVVRPEGDDFPFPSWKDGTSRSGLAECAEIPLCEKQAGIHRWRFHKIYRRNLQ